MTKPFPSLNPGGRRVAAAWTVVAALLTVLASPVGAPAAEPAQQAPSGDEIPLTVGRSVVLDHPNELQRVAVTNPDVADAVPISTREVLINAKGPGVTTLVLWSKSGDRNFFTVSVAMDIQQLQEHIRATFPGEEIQVIASKDVTSLVGNVSNPAIAERAVAMVEGFTGGTVIDYLELPPPPIERQIMLRVRFAEIQRQSLDEFGINLISTGALNTPGQLTTQQFSPASATQLNGTIGAPVVGTGSQFTLTESLNIFAFRPDLNLGATIRLLENQGLAEILAEPNLVTTTGKEANFLVGGEFPVPVIQGGAGVGAVTIQFREFGIRLRFLPQLTAGGSVQMQVRPEVSALDFANAVSLSGFVIPALSTRRVETEVELLPGQSFVVGGLIDNRVTDTINAVPGLSKIPLLGRLFRSRSRDRTNTELLVLVTPEFPEPFDVGEEPDNPPFTNDFLTPMPGSMQQRDPNGLNPDAEKKTTLKLFDWPRTAKAEKKAAQQASDGKN